MQKAAERSTTTASLASLRAGRRSAEALISTLSGGNQQKVLLGRSLLAKPKLFVLEDPTSGIDVGSKYDLYELIRRAAIEGTSFIWLSTDLIETLTLLRSCLCTPSRSDRGRVDDAVVGRRERAHGRHTWARQNGVAMTLTVFAKAGPPTGRLIGRLGLPFLVVVIAIVTGFIEPRFWSVANLQNLLRQTAPLQILVVGQLFAVLSGGLDLSVASVMAFSGVAGVIAVPYVGLPGGIVVMIICGIVFGLINGAIITGFRVSPLIVTLGTLSVVKGLALVATGGLPLYKVPESLIDVVGFGTIFGWPVSSLLAFAVMLIGAGVLRTDDFQGEHVYGVGSNAAAAHSSGVRVGRTILAVYAISGAAAGCAAVVMTAWVSAAQPLAGEGLELQSLAAVVVGGVALTGGSGTMLQALLGVVILGLL